MAESGFKDPQVENLSHKSKRCFSKDSLPKFHQTSKTHCFKLK